jgi:hypothetical protein
MRTPPPPELYGLLHSIESAVHETSKAYPQLSDKDVEAVYDQYRTYFQSVRQGKDPDEPVSTLAHREEALSRIWDALLSREELGTDDHLLHGPWTIAGRPPRDLEEIYLVAFNDLRKSVRFWRKRAGARGYLGHIGEYV